MQLANATGRNDDKHSGDLPGFGRGITRLFRPVGRNDAGLSRRNEQHQEPLLGLGAQMFSAVQVTPSVPWDEARFCAVNATFSSCRLSMALMLSSVDEILLRPHNVSGVVSESARCPQYFSVIRISSQISERPTARNEPYDSRVALSSRTMHKAELWKLLKNVTVTVARGRM